MFQGILTNLWPTSPHFHMDFLLHTPLQFLAFPEYNCLLPELLWCHLTDFFENMSLLFDVLLYHKVIYPKYSKTSINLVLLKISAIYLHVSHLVFTMDLISGKWNPLNTKVGSIWLCLWPGSMVAWPLDILIGQGAADWPIKISSGNATAPET